MKQATKPQIMKDLRAMKANSLHNKRNEIKDKVRMYKLEVISEYDQEIKPLVEKASPIIKEIAELRQKMMADDNINLGNHYHYNFYSTFKSEDEVKEFIVDYSYWQRGKVQVFANKLNKELKELETEWDNLLINCSTMTIGKLRKYIEDNKISVPCMQETKEEPTALQVTNVNLALLFGGENSGTK